MIDQPPEKKRVKWICRKAGLEDRSVQIGARVRVSIQNWGKYISRDFGEKLHGSIGGVGFENGKQIRVEMREF